MDMDLNRKALDQEGGQGKQDRKPGQERLLCDRDGNRLGHDRRFNAEGGI
jgi:hypothetical protein